jgi:hypothetical protein
MKTGGADLEKKIANRPQKKELEEKNILKSKILICNLFLILF